MRRLALAALLGLAACGGAAPPVALDGAWPATGGDYEDVTAAWTRQDEDRHGGNLTVDVAATLKSPTWRAAYVARRAARERLSPAGRDALLAEQRAADAAAYEVELMVATYDRRVNDLQKGDRSVWTVALVGDDGKEIAPTEIVRDRRPRIEVAAEFPALGDFHQPYVARFPRDAALLAPGAKRVTLRMSSGQGAVELVWRAR